MVPKQQSGWTLFLFAAAAVLLVLLAMSLGNLTLSEGYTIPMDEQGNVGSDVGTGTDSGEVWIIIIRGFIALAVLLLPVYIIQSLTSPEGRKRLAADIIILVILMTIATILDNREEPEEFIPMEEEMQAAGNPMDFTVETFTGQPMPELPDQAPQWVTGVVIAVIAVTVTALGFGVWWYLHKRNARNLTALDQLADEAQRAIDDIQGGGDLTTAILRSYAEMTRLVRQELGLARDRAMTARDFEEFLEEKGLPGSPLHTLTVLFEQARYGGSLPGTGEETLAIDSLTEIVRAVRSLKETKAA